MSSTGRHPFFYVSLAIGLALAVLYILVGSLLARYGKLSVEPGWTYAFSGDEAFVADVDPQGVAHGKLMESDRIIAINNNDRIYHQSTFGGRRLPLPSDGDYVLRVQRGATTREVHLTMPVNSHFTNALPSAVILFASLISFAIALLLGLSRPEKQAPRLFALCWFSVALIQMAASFQPMEAFLGKFEIQLASLIWLLSFSPFEIALAYHFYYRFPPEVSHGSCWCGFRSVLYTWGALLTLCFTALRVLMLVNYEAAIDFLYYYSDSFWILGLTNEAYMLFAIIAMALVVTRNYRLVTQQDKKRKIRWIVIGTLAGLFPTVLFFVANLTMNPLGVDTWSGPAPIRILSSLSFIALMIIPLTVGYAIVKHRVFGIQVIMRQGLRYLLARRVLQFLIYLPVGFLLYTFYEHRTEGVGSVLFSHTGYLFLTVGAVLGLRYQKQLQTALDRKFFREAYNSEQIILTLIDQVQTLNSMSEVSRWVSKHLDSALHPEKLFFFYRNIKRGELALGYSSGNHAANLRLSDQWRFVKVAESEARARDFSFFEQLDLPQEEKQWLRDLGIQLVVPINGPDKKLMGLLLLGEKRSEEAYSPTDQKMLHSLAAQIGILCENLLLKEEVDQERKIKRDVLVHLQEEKRNLVKECPVCGDCYDSTVDRCSKDGSELTLTLPVERLIDNRYRLDCLIGRGGMGAVYRASDLSTNEIVAVKVMIGGMFGDPVALRRFQREARASTKLRHPNIIRVFDSGSLQAEGAYLVMEYVTGSTLRDKFHEAQIPPPVAADWFDQLLEGMKYAHDEGIIHRDLKPENILLMTTDGKGAIVKILDFGLAKIQMLDQAESRSLTTPGTVLGTLSYMSPEQLAGSEVDERTDIFSIGVMVAEAITGRPPFEGNTSADLAVAILQKSFNLPGASQEIRRLNEVLQKSLAKNRKNRYESMEDLQKDLIPALRSCPPLPSSLLASAARI